MSGAATEFLRRAEEVFHAALARPLTERKAFLSRACAGETTLLVEVERLLACDGTTSALDEPAWERADPSALELPEEASDPLLHEGARIGVYRLQAELGAGGMGVVWEAERADEQFRQKVAIKFIRPGMASGDVLRRFREERQLLAQLRHPNVAQLFDGGLTSDGRPYLVLEFIAGTPIDRYCAEKRLALRSRIELFLKVCDAVHHAHQNLVIHRDIKPSNVLVTADGTPKLLDFGIAKVLGPSAAELTRTGMHLMTPQYASPEQMLGQPVTTASDVYSLGVVLYELATGVRPYRLEGRPFAEQVRAVCDVDPPRPSTMVVRAEASRVFTPDEEAQRLRSLLRGDLDAIAAKALRKESEHRYATVAELASDLRRHLEGRPVSAQPSTWRYQVGKFVRRNRATVASSLFAIGALVAGTIASTWLYVRERAAAREEHRAHLEAHWRSYSASIAAADAALRKEHADIEARYHLDAAPEIHRGWEWTFLRQRLDRSLWSAETAGHVMAIDYGPDGRSIAVAEGGGKLGPRSAVEVFDARTGDKLASFSDDAAWMRAVAFAPDSQLLAAGDSGGIVHVLDPERCTELEARRAGEKPLCALLLGADGAWIAAAEGKDSESDPGPWHAFVWERGAEPRLRLAHEDPLSSLALHPGRNVLAVGDEAGGIHLWDLREGRELARFSSDEGHGPRHQTVRSLAFSAGGEELFSGSDALIARWDVERRARLDEITLSGQGRMLVVDLCTARALVSSEFTLGGRNAIDLLSLSSDQRLAECLGVPAAGGTLAGDVSPDGSRLVAGLWEHRVYSFDASGSPMTLACAGHTAPVRALAVDLEGRRLASGSLDGSVRLWQPETGLCLATFAPGLDGVQALAFSRQGAELVAGGAGGGIVFLDLSSGAKLGEARIEGGAILALEASPDGELVASAHEDGFIRLWDAHRRECQREWKAHASTVRTLAFDRAGGRLASGGGDWDADTRIHLWHVETGSELATLSGHSGWINALVWTPDGTELYSAGRDNHLRLWNVRDRELVLDVADPFGGYTIEDAALSADGTRLATSSPQPIVRLWEAGGLQSLLPLSGLHERSKAVLWDPQGRWIAAGSEAGEVRIWWNWDPLAAMGGAMVRRLWDQSGDRDELDRALLAYPWPSDAARDRASALAAELR